MAFQIKSRLSILASMINRARMVCSLTDYNVGGVMRTFLDAVAQEIDRLYQDLVLALKDAIQTSTYTTFDFPALAAVAASGTLTVTISVQSSDTVIPAGSVFTPAGGTLTYASVAAVTIPAALTTGIVQVACTTTGTAGNVAAGTTFSMGAPVTGFVSAVNGNLFSNGAPAETAQARQARFARFILGLARSTTAGVTTGLSIVQLTDSNGNVTEAAKFQYVYEPYLSDPTQPTAKIYGYIHNGVGSTSTALVAQAQSIIDGYYEADGTTVPGYVAAGVTFIAEAAPEQIVAVAGSITAGTGYTVADLDALVQAAHQAYILALPLGATVEVAKLDALAMGVDGVLNFVRTAPAADVAAATAWTKPMPGAGTYT